MNLSARTNDFNAWNEALSLVGATSDSSETPDDRLLRATVLSRSGEPRYKQEAIQILEGLVSELPGSLKLHEILARLYLSANERSRARDNAAIAAGDDATPDGILLYSSILLDDKNFEEAEKQFARLRALDANALPTIELQARILKAQGKGAEAVAVIEKAFASREKTPEVVAVGQGIVKLLASIGEDAAAERIARRIAALNGRGKMVLAEYLGTHGKLKEAAEVYRLAAAEGDAREAARSALGLASGELSSNEDWLKQADVLLEQAIRKQPEAVELLQARAYLRHLQRNYDEEIQLYNQVMSRNPSSYVFLNNWAWTLSEELGKPDEGLKRVTQAIEKVGKQPHILDTRGVIFLRLGRVDEAVADLEIAAAAIPSGTIYFHLARAYEKAGRKDDFAKFLQKARDAKLKPDQLQPSEQAEYQRILKPATTTSAGGDTAAPEGLAREAGR
jgi:Tfp pilus assembly protein PilF